MATSVSRARPTRSTAAHHVARTTSRTSATPSLPLATSAKVPAKIMRTPKGPLAMFGAAKAAINQPGRGERLMNSIQSVQEPSKVPWPRWRKFLTWAIMLMPVYAIIIYVIGAFYFLPAELNGVGLAKSLPVKNIAMVGDIAVPNVNALADKNGVFLQSSTDPHQTLPMIMQFNDRTLQPPVAQQMSMKASQLRYVLVTQLQVSLPGDYHIYRIGQGADRLVATNNAKVHISGIAEMALAIPKGTTWQPGDYMLTLPQAGLDDETYYCFFQLQ